MKRNGIAALGWLLFCFLCHCDPDPAGLVRVIARPSVLHGGEAPSAVLSRGVDGRPAGCPPSPDDERGPGLLKVSGPCSFEQHEVAKCKAKLDDFFVIAERRGENGAKLTIYLNVENYHGPGRYLLSIMHLNLQDGNSLYRWTSDGVSVTVGENEAYVDLPLTRLDAEPVLNTCSPVIASDGSYHFPCSAKHVDSPVEFREEVVSGKIVCAQESP